MIILITSFSFRSILKNAKLWIKLIVLVLILFYILPKLMDSFWNNIHPGPKIKDEQLLEKPLRVMETILEVT